MARLIGGESEGPGDQWPGPPLPGEREFINMMNKLKGFYFEHMASKFQRKAQKAKDPAAVTFYSYKYWEYFNKSMEVEE
jgi:hypothetical protein